MRKELNPAFFGEDLGEFTGEEAVGPTDANLFSQNFSGSRSGRDILPTQVLLEQQIVETRIQVKNLNEHLAKIVAQINEFIKGSQMKFEKFHAAIHQLEQNDKNILADSSQKISSIQSRLGERRTMDLKVQEMIDRHNSVLKTFEVRLNQMQKMMIEKEAQMASAQSALNEAKMEITRLKRI